MTSIVIITIAFLAALVFKLTKTEHARLYRFLLYSHWALLGLTATVLLLLCYSYSFAGYYTDKLIVIVFVATGILLFGLYRKKQKLARTYFTCFFSLPILLIVGLIIPRLRFITTVAGIGLLMDGEHYRYTIDKAYSIETSTVGFLSGGPRISLVENKYLLFEKTTKDVIQGIGIPTSFKVEKVGADSVRLNIVSSDVADGRLDTVIALKR